jgi:hypothetical protein
MKNNLTHFSHYLHMFFFTPTQYMNHLGMQMHTKVWINMHHVTSCDLPFFTKYRCRTLIFLVTSNFRYFILHISWPSREGRKRHSMQLSMWWEFEGSFVCIWKNKLYITYILIAQLLEPCNNQEPFVFSRIKYGSFD